MTEPYGRVYLITNTLSGKRYVGQTKLTLAKRWRSHIHAMGNRRRDQPMTAALRKYGPDKFVMAELETCGDQVALDESEKAWALQLNTFAPTGYNLRAGSGPNAVSEVTRARLKASMTDERRKALSDLWRGRRLPDEAYAAASAARAARRRAWTLLDPAGDRVVMENPGAFCEEYGLMYSNLRQVALGVRPSHRGWRLLPPLPSPAALVEGARLRCPTCRDEFPQAMRAAAQTHANACLFVPFATAEAIRLGHGTAEEVSAAVTRLPALKGRSAPTRQKRFALISPEGVVIEVVGLLRFAHERGLQPSSLSRLISGKLQQYRGWRRAECNEGVNT